MKAIELLRYSKELIWHRPNAYIHALSLVSIVYGINLLLGLARDSVLVAYFGATSELDAFMLGFSFVKMIGLQITIAFASGLTPYFVELVENRRFRDICYAVFQCLIISLCLTILVAAALINWAKPISYILGPGLSQDGLLVLQLVLSTATPIILLLGIAGLTKSLADTHGLYTLHPILLGAMVLGLVVGVFVNGISGGIIGAIALIICSLILQFFFLWRRSFSGYINSFAVGNSNLLHSLPNFTTIINLPYGEMLSLLMVGFLVQARGVVSRSYASMLSEGSVVALTLALSIVGIPLMLFLQATSSVLLPYLSRKESSNTGLVFGLSRAIYTRLSIGLIAMTAILWFSSDFFVDILFNRGNFTDSAAALTAMFVRILSLGYMAYVLSTILRQVIIAKKMMKYDLIISISLIVLHVMTLEIFIPKLGHVALALSAITIQYLRFFIYMGVLAWASSGNKIFS